MSADVAHETQISRQAAPAPVSDPTARIAAVATIAGRALIALLFVLAGVLKILGPKPFLAHMAAFGVPTILLPAVIALEMGAGLAVLVGWRLRETAGALALFCVMTATIFHHQLGVSAERTSFFKDLAIAGGLMFIAATAARQRGASGAKD